MVRAKALRMPSSDALARGVALAACSMALGAACCWLGGISDSQSDAIGRLVAGMVLGLIASPAFLYAMWHPPRLRKGIAIVALNLLAALIIGQALGVGGALFVSGPAFFIICASFGGDGRRAALEHARARNICAACGYSLAGNESGTCPECGQRVSTVE